MARPKGSKDRVPRAPYRPRQPKDGALSATKRAAAKAEAGHNSGLNVANLHKAIGDVERQMKVLASLQGEYRNSCRGPRAAIKAVEQWGRENGVPTNAFRAQLKIRELERRLNKIPVELEQDDAVVLAKMRESLGSLYDLPLGAAAVEREMKDRGAAAVNSIAGFVSDAPAAEDEDVRPRHLRDADVEAGDKNAAALESGIRQLN